MSDHEEHVHCRPVDVPPNMALYRHLVAKQPVLRGFDVEKLKAFMRSTKSGCDDAGGRNGAR